MSSDTTKRWVNLACRLSFRLSGLENRHQFMILGTECSALHWDRGQWWISESSAPALSGNILLPLLPRESAQPRCLSYSYCVYNSNIIRAFKGALRTQGWREGWQGNTAWEPWVVLVSVRVESSQVPEPSAQTPFLIFCFPFCKQGTY